MQIDGVVTYEETSHLVFKSTVPSIKPAIGWTSMLAKNLTHINLQDIRQQVKVRSTYLRTGRMTKGFAAVAAGASLAVFIGIMSYYLYVHQKQVGEFTIL